MDDLTVRTSETSGVAAAATAGSEIARTARDREATRPAESTATEVAPTGDSVAGATGSSVTRETLEATIAAIERNVRSNNEIRFKLSPEDGELVVQVIDRESDEVIRSIPPERLVEFAERSTDSSTGLLLDDLA